MNALRRFRALTALALLAPLWLGGCGAGEELIAPRPTGLEVSAEHSGAGADPDGIVVVVDSNPSHALLPDSTLELPDLPPGVHTLAVEGLGPGCTLTGPNPRDVTVIPDSLVRVVLEIACAVTGLGGTLVVAVETGGVDLDSDGYAVLLDALPPRPLGAEDTITFTGLSTDSHVVRLGDVPDRCGIAGDNPHAFQVEASDTATIRWEVTCWPPASGRIAFVRIPVERAVGRNIFMINADGRGLTQLTRPEDNVDQEPEWSPDGTRVAYVNDTSTFNRETQLRVVDVASRTVLVIPTGSPRPVAPHWSPDGTQLSFEATDDESVFHVYLVDADGRGLPRRLATVGKEIDAAWSPDGTHLAFRGTPESGNTARVYVTDLTGTTSTPISPSGLQLAASDDGIDWSPDGSRIVFAAAHPLGIDFGSDLYVMAVDGSGLVNLTESPPFGSNVRPRWSPDGRRIAYACSVVSRSGTVGDICTISLEGGPPTNLTRNLEFYHDFGWSPDGSRVVFSRPDDEGGSAEDLFFVDAYGGGLTRLTTTADNEFMPSWGR